MTCEECEAIQNRLGEVPIAYVRVDKANVGIVGCKNHVRALLDLYNRGLETIEKAEGCEKKKQ